MMSFLLVIFVSNFFASLPASFGIYYSNWSVEISVCSCAQPAREASCAIVPPLRIFGVISVSWSAAISGVV